MADMPASGEFNLVNAFEDLVKTNLWDLMQKMEMCTCEKCFLDACALVFNKNKQYNHYVTTRRGEVLSKVPDMNHSNHVELIVAITEALQMVKNFPKH